MNELGPARDGSQPYEVIKRWLNPSSDSTHGDQVLIVDLSGNGSAAREASTIMGADVPEAGSGMVVI